MSKGLFIVFEGIDGSGTTTQCELLASYIEERGYPVVQTREPGGTPLAEKIRKLVLDPAENIHCTTEMLLYAASRAQHVHELVDPALKEGKTVICDRFIASSLAYQGYGRDLGVEVVRQVNRYAVADCLPDLTIYLDLPLDVAILRRQQRAGSPDRLEREGDQLQEKVSLAYREVAKQQLETALILDATAGEEELADEIRTRLRERWPAFPFRNREE